MASPVAQASYMSTPGAEDVFRPAPEDYSSVFAPPLNLGMGSASGHQFTAGLLGMVDARRQGLDKTPIAPLVASQTKSISNMTPDQLYKYLGNLAGSNLATGLSKYLNGVGEQYAQTEDPQIQAAAQATVDQVKETATNGTLSDNIATGTFLAMNGEKNPTQRYAIRTAGMTQIFNQFVENHFSDTMLSKAGDIAGLLVPGRTTLGEAKHGLSPWALHQLVVDFHAQIPADQIKTFPQMLNYLYEVSGQNRYVFESAVEPFLSRQDITSVRNTFLLDVVDVASVFPFLKVAKMARISGTPIRMVREMGDIEVGGKMVAEAVTEPTGTVADLFGTSPHDAATMSMPFGGEASIKEITNGLNVEAQSTIEKMLGPERKVMNRIVSGANEEYIMRGALTSAEEAAYQEKIMQTHAGNAKVVGSNEQGFTLRVALEQAGHTPTDVSEATQALNAEREALAGLKVQRSEMKASLGKAADKDKDYQVLVSQIVDSNKKIVGLETLTEQIGNKGYEGLHTPVEYKNIRYTRNAIGTWDVMEYSLANKFSSAADTIVNQIAPGEVLRASTIEYTQKQLRDLFNIAGQDVFKGLKKNERVELNTLLDHGYDIGRSTRFGTMDLITGIQTKNGVVRLKTAEQVARYHAARDILDSVYMLANSKVRKQLLFENFTKAIKVKNTQGEMLNFIRPHRTISELPEDVKEIYDTTLGRVIKVGSKDIIDSRIARGEVGLYEAKLPIEYENGKKVTYVLADKTAIRDLPDRVLNYKAHYRPQIYKNIFHVVVEHTDDFINGNVVRGRRILRAFDNKTEAQKFVDLAKTNPKNPNAANRVLEIRNGNEFRDPNLTDKALKEEYETKVFGGLFTGETNPEPLRFGLQNTTAETMSALESMESAINNVSTQVPMNEWRMGMIQRFLNTAKNPVNTAESYLSDPTNWRSAIKPNAPNGVKYMQDWLGHVFNVQTTEERAFNKALFRVGSWLDNESMLKFKPANVLRKWAMNQSATDIYGRARTIAFHSLLGWLNPRQLYVQAAGASAAISVNPEKALYLIPRYMALRAVMYADNAAEYSIARAAMASAGKGFMDEGKFIDMVKAFRRAGVRDSIRTTADYDAAVRGFGMSRSMLRRAADRGLYFLRESELFNRSYNWLWAHDKFMTGKAVGYRLTNRDVDAITQDSLRIGMNLMRANAAGFQKGVLSLPFQFQQISTKFIGNMMYSMKSGRGNWTGFERAKIGLGQVLLFGAAGVPFATWMTKEVINWAKDDGDYGLGIKDPDAIAAVSGGLTDYMLGKWAGAPEDVASSMSYGGNLTQFLEQFVNSDISFAQIAQGAFGEVPRRAIQALGNVAPLLAGDIKAGDISAGDMGIMASELGTVVSSWRNVHKANMWAQSGLLTNSKGEVYRHIDPEQDAGMLIAQKWGMAPKELYDLAEHKKFYKATQDDLKEVVDAWNKLVLMHMNNGDYNTTSGRERAKFQIAWIMRNLTEEQRTEVGRRMVEKIKENKETYKTILLHDIEARTQTEGNAAQLELTTTEIPK